MACSRPDLREALVNPKNWWKYLLVVLVIGAAGVMYMGVKTYDDAPPIPDFKTASGTVVASRESILDGQAVFQKYALMQYGTMFGDGGARGPDFTAEALHQVAVSMNTWYEAELKKGNPKLAGELQREGVQPRVQREIKQNLYDSSHNSLVLSEAQAFAYAELEAFYLAKFKGAGPDAFKPSGYITSETEIKQLTAFFFWGAWVCGAQRPGGNSSFTHNWPYDELAGNRPTSGTILWSVIGSFALILVFGGVLFFHGRMSAGNGWQPGGCEPVATRKTVDAQVVTVSQRATYKFFAVAMILFFLQVVAGILTVHDFVGFTVFFDYDLSTLLPLTITRSWHVQLSVLWIATCWIAGSLFLLPRIAPIEPAGQVRLINSLFSLLVVVVVGMLAGTALGPHGLLGDYWRSFGNQGWEFVELGKFFQWLLFASLGLWAYIMYRGLKPALKSASPFALPNWMLYAVLTITLLFGSGFVAGARSNFVIADFWRWCVIHMWAECFFEVFTTVIIAYFMVMMGLISREAANRVVFIATILFLGSGLLGISHNFYWNAKPEPMLAIGAVFSTLQVIPLILLTLEAWKFRNLPGAALRGNGVRGGLEEFGLSEAFLFLMAVNFWNFFGAGVFGFIINLPIVNYYEHGTYLTVNHGHAALMGVYGNLSIAAVLFCGRLLIKAERWNAPLVRMSFWSLNIGLLLMILLDTFPAGILQFIAVIEGGMWKARSEEFIQSSNFQTLTWMRAIGGAMFFLGGVTPLAWFAASRMGSLKSVVERLPAALPLFEEVEHEPAAASPMELEPALRK